MNAETENYSRELRWILNQFSSTLSGLTEAQLSWKAPTAEGNSASAITNHLVSATRVYALGFGCGGDVPRDRQSEFKESSVSASEIVAIVDKLSMEIETAFADLSPAKLTERIMPPQELWGTGVQREISRREAVIESIRHAAIHLGELRLTRDLAILHS